MLLGGVKRQKTVQNDKKILSVALHISGNIRGAKREKTAQNDKKLCLSRSISQESYIIGLPFMVEMCKKIISPGVFFNVKILIFQDVKGLKGQIRGQNDENFCLS